MWVPEHPYLPLYRSREPRKEGKLGLREWLVTANIHEALQFDTRVECEHWIADNPEPPFKAREHLVG